MIQDAVQERALEYLYKRSIVLYQEQALRRLLIDHLRAGNPLPKRDSQFRPIVERFLRSQIPVGAIDEKRLQEMVDFYMLFGKTRRQRSRWLVPVIVTLVLGLLVAVMAGSVASFLSETPESDLNSAFGTTRTILLVVIVVGLYYWASIRLQAMLNFVRLTLLLVMILALVWLLNDNGIISINQWLSLN
jgi:hypothetical protein